MYALIAFDARVFGVDFDDHARRGSGARAISSTRPSQRSRATRVRESSARFDGSSCAARGGRGRVSVDEERQVLRREHVDGAQQIEALFALGEHGQDQDQRAMVQPPAQARGQREVIGVPYAASSAGRTP